jgi:hypothetical protein
MPYDFDATDANACLNALDTAVVKYNAAFSILQDCVLELRTAGLKHRATILLDKCKAIGITLDV